MLLELAGNRCKRRFGDADEQTRKRWQHEASQLDQPTGQSFWQVAWRLVHFMQEHHIPTYYADAPCPWAPCLPVRV